VDLIFGVLEGYWIYSDFDIRPHHAVISGKKWESVFQRCSFDSTTSLTCYSEQQTVVLACANDTTPIYKPPSISLERSNTWILLCDNDSKHSKFFQQKLNNVGKNVIVVTPAEAYLKSNPQSYEIRRQEKSDMEHLLNSVQKEDGHTIEGILYLWGLDNYGKDQAEISRAMLNLSQILLGNKFKVYPRCYVFTGGIMPVTDQGPCNPSSGTLWGLSRSLRSEQPNLTCRCIDTTLDDMNCPDRMEELFMEMWNEDGENQVAYREGRRYVVRFISTKLAFTDLQIPNSNRFALTLPASKTFADLKFDVHGTHQLQGKEIELQVKAAGLNFRDVFNVLKPDSQFDKSNAVGADFCGVITALGPECCKLKVGDFVVGCNFESAAMPSHVKTLEDAVVPPGETILIHTASGGVGICAIQLANWLGAKVIATAGSKRKRAFLRDIMGLENVFHSRNLTFGADIERVTGGVGVQMVLNSITGPGKFIVNFMQFKYSFGIIKII
jgi:hypothetical protein